MPEPAPSAASAAELQDHLLTASHDLDRLEGLLAHACDALLEGFQGAAGDLRGLLEAGRERPDRDGLNHALQHLNTSITALQFQDLAAQLIAHTHQRLRHCADRIAHDTLDAGDGEAVVEAAPPHANPVTQDEMHAGSVELFCDT